jgi:hypothetical protein
VLLTRIRAKGVVLRLVLLLFVLAVALLVRALPWWATAGGLLVLAAVAWLLRRRLFLVLFSLPFRMKGKALRRASAEIHSLTPAKGETKEGERLYELEVTITPDARAGAGAFTTWELGELLLVPRGAKVALAEGDDEAIPLDDLEVFLDGRYQPDEGWKLGGPQRLKARIAVPEGPEKLEFRYYFEQFGEVVLPCS